MEGFHYRGGVLHADQIPVDRLADEVGTPTYVYSAAGIRTRYRRLADAFSPLGARLHYAVKASGNLNLLRFLRELGAGMDVVSIGELERAWLAGAPMDDIVFAGVGKTDDEIRAALDGRFSRVAEAAEWMGRDGLADRGPVGLFNVESPSELARIQTVSEELSEEVSVTARACLRVNPDVDARTHEYTTTGKEENKFGIEVPEVERLFDAYRDRPGVDLVGLHVHIGSPVREIEPYQAAVRVLLALMERLESKGHRISVLNLGGGWPISHYDDEAPPVTDYAEAIVPLLQERADAGLKIRLEPGRSIIGNSGILLTRVHHVKEGRLKRFVICDAGIHTLIRPALYQAFHTVWPTRTDALDGAPPFPRDIQASNLVRSDVVGPICETGDFLARGRDLPASISRGDLLAVFSAGAYGMSMCSNYNDHGRPAEILVDGDHAQVIGERQPQTSILAAERTIRELSLSGSSSSRPAKVSA